MKVAVYFKIKLLIPVLFLTLLLTTDPSGLVTKEAHAGCSDTAAPGVEWNNCRKRNLIMAGFDFTGSSFKRTDLSASDLRNSNFENTNFEKANLMRASLAGSKAPNSNFTGITASRTDFSRGNYRNANFQKAEINRADFSSSDLENANMSKADLSRVNFQEANLKGVNLSFSNISRANFKDTSLDENFALEGAFMFLTRVEGLDLSQVKGLAQWQIDMACGDENTILPEGFSKPQSWPCDFEETE